MQSGSGYNNTHSNDYSANNQQGSYGAGYNSGYGGSSSGGYNNDNHYNNSYNNFGGQFNGAQRGYGNNPRGGNYRTGGGAYRTGGHGGQQNSSYGRNPYGGGNNFNNRRGGGRFNENRGYGGNNNYGGGGGYQQRYGGGDSMGQLGSELRAVDWSQHELMEVKKDFYVEHPDVMNMSENETDEMRKDKGITIKSGQNVNKPLSKFEYAGFPKPIMDNIMRAGFASPSPIQAQTWPIALAGRDMIGIAQTGSGKTLAFLLPAIVHISAQPPQKPGEGPIALVLAPTRELAEQILSEANKFLDGTEYEAGVCYGGVPKRRQMAKLSGICHVLIATPGRLIDFLTMNVTNLRRTTFLILDEADRMLDMGFEPQIKKIVSQIRDTRQTLMLSATWPKSVEQLAINLFNSSEPVHILIGNEDLTANRDITQHVKVLDNRDKNAHLEDIIRKHVNEKVIIFVDTKKKCDEIAWFLRNKGIRAAAIHGDKKQDERSYLLREFSHGNNKVLVATDVASRGLDVKDVAVVVNMDMPPDIESYVHRIGRTGRAGAKGTAYAFMTAQNSKLARELISLLKEAQQDVPAELSGLQYMGGGGGYGGGRGYGGRGKGNNFGGHHRRGGNMRY